MTRSEYRKLLMKRCPRDPSSGQVGCATAAWCPVIKDEMPELPQPPWECAQIVEWRGFLIFGMPTAEFLQRLEEDGDGRAGENDRTPKD